MFGQIAVRVVQPHEVHRVGLLGTFLRTFLFAKKVAEIDRVRQ